MKITILGCGSSGGVPLIGCDCPVCKSKNKKNKRSRVSILVEHKGTTLLIDTSPDLRQQALQNNIRKIDAVLYTHAHADHVMGIDELRSYNYAANRPLDIYADHKTMKEIRQRFDYVFLPHIVEYGWFRPCLVANEINVPQKFTIGNIEVQSFVQGHGKVMSVGYRFGKFAYSTDVNEMPEGSLSILKGVETWVVDCLSYKKAPTHAHLDLSLKWIDIVKPKKAILTHMNHEVDYNKLLKKLPRGVVPAYDGMIINV